MVTSAVFMPSPYTMSWRLASFMPTYQSVGSILSIFTAAFIVNVVPNNKAVNIFFILSFFFNTETQRHREYLLSYLKIQRNKLCDSVTLCLI